MTPDEHRYYTSHSVESDPGEMGELLASLPKDPTQIVDAVSGLVLDRGFVARQLGRASCRERVYGPV